MDFKVDYGSSKYKRFRLKMLGDSYNRGERLDSSKFGVDPGMPKEIASNNPQASTHGNLNSDVAYCCKKCRRVVALQENIVDHIPGEGMTSFHWHKRNGGNRFENSEDSGCTSIFAEPLKWMKTVAEGGVEGKMSCAHCDARLGYFNWSGTQCNCGSWITPGSIRVGWISVPSSSPTFVPLSYSTDQDTWSSVISYQKKVRSSSIECVSAQSEELQCLAFAFYFFADILHYLKWERKCTFTLV